MVTTPENINKKHDLVKLDREMKVHKIVSVVDIANKWVPNILHQHFNIKLLFERWAPPTFIVDQKPDGDKLSKVGLLLFQWYPQNFYRCFVK